MSKLSRIQQKLLRNNYSIGGGKSNLCRINLEWWSKKVNLGDVLATVIYDYMLKKRGISPDIQTKKTIHLLTVGSLIGMRDFDAVIWGSGMHTFSSMCSVMKNRKRAKMDIRAVRGPLTREVLVSCGYDCRNACMGDPAVIMPDLYQSAVTEKKYRVSVIRHLKYTDVPELPVSCHAIAIQTNDYKQFIDEIVSSELVISSSLHGIILAETYGVPAIFLNEFHQMDNELFKYYDWYYSTGRDNIIIAHTVEEALQAKAMPLPNLEEMRKGLLEAFPYDLWEQ